MKKKLANTVLCSTGPVPAYSLRTVSFSRLLHCVATIILAAKTEHRVVLCLQAERKFSVRCQHSYLPSTEACARQASSCLIYNH